MTRRGKRIIPSMWWNSCDTTRSTIPGWVNLKASWIASAFSTPREKHKTRNCDRLQGFADEVLQMAKGADQLKKLEEPKGDYP
jgi:hypothetical protein